jgi:predicted permease
MIIHCVNNSIPTIFSYLPTNINYSKLAQSNFKISLIFSLIGIIVIAIMIIFLNKENNKRRELQQLNIR